MNAYAEQAVTWMTEYLRVDTTNPPGNEARAAAFFKKVLDAEGIENRVIEYAPGRANLWARIKGSGARRPLILLNHTDVVTSDPARWRVPPFAGEVVEGALYGRGAQDMKDEGLAQLLVMVMLQREKVALDRDVIFLATADEEAEGSGTDWVIANKKDWLADAEYLITEGGSNRLENGQVKYVGVDVAEKTTFWLRVTAHGRPGHGSRPLDASAPNRLVRALGRILDYRPPLKVLPVAEQFLAAMARYETPERAAKFRDIRRALKNRRFRAEVEQDEFLRPLLQNTISVTMLGGSQQTNVIPGEAWANLDVRLLPGEDPKAFLETMRRVVADSNVSVEPLDGEFRVANESPTNTELWAEIERVSARYFPQAPVAPRLTSGYTENQRYRPLGIVCYGFSPHASTDEESRTAHGDNERIRVEEVRRGFRVLFDVVVGVAATR
ncbi:MAG TPA: M20/M25/M40 family metallo-hydrolase [Terriglobales bacterium]|nr:M20/M25/M40 family metallo-hydrolase [Terriglobales bacterium]